MSARRHQKTAAATAAGGERNSSIPSAATHLAFPRLTPPRLSAPFVHEIFAAGTRRLATAWTRCSGAAWTYRKIITTQQYIERNSSACSDSHLTQIIRLWPDTNLLEQWVLLRSSYYYGN